ncbi:phosphatidylethanolamine-binding protein 4 isoform X1 [Cyprinodon tularosa]|uniref:phosphatidylethanolamine-binding protein 4 isoform X1 n=1 Tax=Cyprinodon tularosa TaxID=77115 RepID=UPI0018E227EC|nr:phosphatidylethanolamine-binding protein 4 isoform X1 [Cyprinodon tularosa]
MALLGLFLVSFAFLWEPYKTETILLPQDLRDASFCHGGLKVVYPELDIDQCSVIPNDKKLREKLSKVWKAPQIYFPKAQKKRMYVLVMVDPDVPRRSAHPAYWRHWLVVNIKGSSLLTGEIRGETLTDYLPPTPPQRSGYHRYQFMLFEQPPHTKISLTKEESSRGKWNLQGFIRRFNLEDVATLQFLTQHFKD